MISEKSERLFKIILQQIVSEKSTAEKNQSNKYVFHVINDATKPEILFAVEKLFGVNVESVRVLNLKGKRKRFRGRLGWRSDVRKAYVRVKADQDIDIGF